MFWDAAVFAAVTWAAWCGIKRGMALQAASLASMAVGVSLAAWCAPGIEGIFAPATSDPFGRRIAAFFLVLGLVGLCFNMAAALAVSYMEIRDLRPYDKVLGGGFGAARGLLLVAVALGAILYMQGSVPGLDRSLFAWRVAEAGQEILPAECVPAAIAEASRGASRLGRALGIRGLEEDTAAEGDGVRGKLQREGDKKVRPLPPDRRGRGKEGVTSRRSLISPPE